MHTTEAILEWSVAGGTVLAGVFAAVAARSAARSARSSEQLIKLEQERDAAASVQAARSVLLEVVSSHHAAEDVTFVCCRATNSGTSPVTKCRIRVLAGGQTYGPQLFGALYPGMSWQLIVPFRGNHALSQNLGAKLRFVDVSGVAWVTDAYGAYEGDEDVTPWIEEAKAFATEALSRSAFWRGSSAGSVPIQFDTWPPSPENFEALLELRN